MQVKRVQGTISWAIMPKCEQSCKQDFFSLQRLQKIFNTKIKTKSTFFVLEESRDQHPKSRDYSSECGCSINLPLRDAGSINSLTAAVRQATSSLYLHKIKLVDI